ncbi:hypothetical protein EGT07_12670 [Herbaspirillum sp. HC18]|nr:hypothetical protein EGT07_12670 [Herbaspirillum sp. HC18]
MQSAVSKLAQAERRLREEIDAIVKRRAPRESHLSWRLMFEIEDEAVSRLEDDAGLDMRYINLMVSPSAQRMPRDAACTAQSEVYPTRTALRMIQEAFHQH